MLRIENTYTVFDTNPERKKSQENSVTTTTTEQSIEAKFVASFVPNEIPVPPQNGDFRTGDSPCDSRQFSNSNFDNILMAT